MRAILAAVQSEISPSGDPW